MTFSGIVHPTILDSTVFIICSILVTMATCTQYDTVHILYAKQPTTPANTSTQIHVHIQPMLKENTQYNNI